MAPEQEHDSRLWSERRGGDLPLTDEGFATLLGEALNGLAAGRYFMEVLQISWGSLGMRVGETASAFFAMKLGDPWPVDKLQHPYSFKYEQDDRTFDLLELLYRDVVSKQVADPPAATYNRAAGRAEFRKRINPVLARRDPPLELLETGHIVQRVQEPFRRLVEQPLPDHAPKKEVTDRVDDAVQHFRRRHSTAGDRRAAVRELADVLEFLRADVKEHLLSEDERALFRLANEFAIRHNKRETRRDFDEPAWLAWAFYVYLATIRLTLELRSRA